MLFRSLFRVAALWVVFMANADESKSSTPLFKVVPQGQGDQVVQNAEYIESINKETRSLIDAGRLSEARELFEEARRLSEQINDDEGRAYAYANLGSIYFVRGMLDSVIVQLNSPYQELQHTSRALHTGNLIATAHRDKSEHTKALQIYLEVLERAENEGNLRMETAIRQNLGDVYESLGDISAAIDTYFASLELAEQLNDSLTLPVVYENLALLNMREGNNELAESYLINSLEISTEINNMPYMTNAYINLGVLYKDLDRYEESLESYENALNIADELGNIVMPIQVRYNIGILFYAQKKYDLAMDYFRESLEISREQNIQLGYFYNYIGMADVFKDTGRFDEAIDYFEHSLELAETFADMHTMQSILEKMYDAHEQNGDTIQAFHYLKRYSAMRDSLSGEDREEALARQEALLNLRLERQNRELAETMLASQRTTLIISFLLLFVIAAAFFGLSLFYRKKNRANMLLQEKKNELEKVNDEKDKLLSILAHDLRAPISNLQGVVYLIQEGVLKNEDLDEILQNVDYQLKQGITTLSNYLQWAQNQKEGIRVNFTQVKIKDIVDETLEEMKIGAEKKSLTIDTNIGNNIYAKADPDMMQVVLRNLISNAIKFVDQGGFVKVSAIEEGEKIVLSVSDSGNGIPEEKQDHIFDVYSKTSKGTMGEIGTGLGLSICKDFVEKQNGSINFKTEIGTGTVFYVELRKPV